MRSESRLTSRPRVLRSKPCQRLTCCIDAVSTQVRKRHRNVSPGYILPRSLASMLAISCRRLATWTLQCVTKPGACHWSVERTCDRSCIQSLSVLPWWFGNRSTVSALSQRRVGYIASAKVRRKTEPWTRSRLDWQSHDLPVDLHNRTLSSRSTDPNGSHIMECACLSALEI